MLKQSYHQETYNDKGNKNKRHKEKNIHLTRPCSRSGRFSNAQIGSEVKKQWQRHTRRQIDERTMHATRERHRQVRQPSLVQNEYQFLYVWFFGVE